MYQEFFGIKENPFSLTPNPRYLYMAKGHQEALAHLLYGVSEGGGFVLLTGEVGTGKTTVCRCLMEQLPAEAEVALILNPRLDEIELLANICDELNVETPEPRSLKVLVDRLNEHFLKLHAEGRHAVLIIDEAQNLSPAVLEQIRLLTNLETDQHKLLQIILIGQPELGELLNRQELRQLAQRISARYHLKPLDAAEAKACLVHRLKVGGLDPRTFSSGARAEVYRRSGGVPRLINSLCDRCLLAAYVQGTRRVDWRMVRAAAAEVFGGRRKTRKRRRMALSLAAAAVLASLATAALIAPRDPWQPVGISDASVAADAPMPPESPPEEPEEERQEGKERETEEQETQEVSTDDPAPAEPARGLQIPDQRTAIESAAGQAAAENAPSAPLAGVPALAAVLPEETAAPPAITPAAITPAAITPAAITPAAITLDQLFALEDVEGDRDSALTRLFALWRGDYDAFAVRNACDQAREGGFGCVSGRGGIQTLRTLDRPALLPLDVQDGRPIHVVLTGLDGPWLTLEAGERQVRARAEEIEAVWTGRYLALWQPPAVYRRNLKRGDNGADVAWLKDRLAGLRGEAPDAAAEAVFDAELEAQVIAFQRSRTLVADGIVGVRTMIQLNNAAGGPDSLRLAAGP